jgi:hypothetical protein
MYICIHAYSLYFLCIYAYMHTYIHTCIHIRQNCTALQSLCKRTLITIIRTHIHTHTHIHTYIHTYIHYIHIRQPCTASQSLLQKNWDLDKCESILWNQASLRQTWHDIWWKILIDSRNWNLELPWEGNVPTHTHTYIYDFSLCFRQTCHNISEQLEKLKFGQIMPCAHTYIHDFLLLLRQACQNISEWLKKLKFGITMAIHTHISV